MESARPFNELRAMAVPSKSNSKLVFKFFFQVQVIIVKDVIT